MMIEKQPMEKRPKGLRAKLLLVNRESRHIINGPVVSG